MTIDREEARRYLAACFTPSNPPSKEEMQRMIAGVEKLTEIHRVSRPEIDSTTD